VRFFGAGFHQLDNMLDRLVQIAGSKSGSRSLLEREHIHDQVRIRSWFLSTMPQPPTDDVVVVFFQASSIKKLPPRIPWKCF